MTLLFVRILWRSHLYQLGMLLLGITDLAQASEATCVLCVILNARPWRMHHPTTLLPGL